MREASSSARLPELTLRGCLIAAMITIVFTASNIYLGLKVGLTFSSAIPAAVISMAILKLFKHSNILENCTVQTFASAAGTLSAVIFILPGLVIIGFWTGFPFWQTSIMCATGGVLGVMYTIPLRRALVVESDLPYPEGVAAAEVLKLGSNDPAHIKLASELAKYSGAGDILKGGIFSTIFSLLGSGFHLLSTSFSGFIRIGNSVVGLSSEYSLALIGAGYLIGIRIGLSILLGLVVGWVFAVPYFSSHEVIPAGMALSDFASQIWSTKVRYIGVGMIAVAALWTIILLLRPIAKGISSSFAALKARHLGDDRAVARQERDIPLHYVLFITGLLLIPILLLLGFFVSSEHLPLSTAAFSGLMVILLLFVLVIGFVIAATTGYMAGVIGSSCCPLSGIGVFAVIIASLVISYYFSIFVLHAHISTAALHHSSIALTIFMTSVVVVIASISNDNLQDLKTGQLVGATPWRQQVALILGVLVGAAIIPPVLELVYNAYGFVGAPLPHAGMSSQHALAAPQAALMSTLAQGIITHHMHWDLLAVGALVAVAVILFDSVFLKMMQWKRLSVLSVGIGLYLPMQIDVALIIGTIISFIVEANIGRQHRGSGPQESLAREGKLRRGVLVASGFIVGEALLGVVMAGIMISTGQSSPLALVGKSFAETASILGAITFIAICIGYCRYVTRDPVMKADEK